MITGEAVLIDIPPAPLPHRMLSGLIDFVTYLAVLAALLVFVSTQLAWVSVAGGTAAVLVCVVGSLVVLPLTVETLSRGRSLGKLIMSLRTVRDDGGPIVFRHAFVRALLGIIEIFMLTGVPAIICGLATVRVKRIGDLAAGTYVVRLERLRPLPPPPGMPMPLMGWAQSCDIAPLPDGLALGIRGFLMRAAGLTPQARAGLAASLTAQVMRHVAPPPPADAPAEAVLAAVLAETRRREIARSAVDQQVRSRLLPPDPLAGRATERPPWLVE